jgi:hypothetical protein
MPSPEQIAAMLTLRLGGVGLNAKQAKNLTRLAEGSSFADVARACDDAIRSMALDDRDTVIERDIASALDELKRRDFPGRQ